MAENKHIWSRAIVNTSLRHPWKMLIAAFVITLISIGFAQKLQMRMNWTDILPAADPIVQSYREVQEKFGNAGGLVIALEGN